VLVQWGDHPILLLRRFLSFQRSGKLAVFGGGIGAELALRAASRFSPR